MSCITEIAPAAQYDINKRSQSSLPLSRNNGAIMDKMHNQMFFEDLFPQINSL